MLEVIKFTSLVLTLLPKKIITLYITMPFQYEKTLTKKQEADKKLER